MGIAERYVQTIAIFMICLMINMTIVHALAIHHDTSADIKAGEKTAVIRWITAS